MILRPRPPWVPEVDETGDTLLANARLKAHALVAATGLAAIADDTGLEVDDLDGAPGVFSSRYAGSDATYADNVAKLLAALSGVREPRPARFRTVAVAAGRTAARPSQKAWWKATSPPEARGQGGFGYDPVFVPADGDGRTFAEMSSDEKHLVSHRGRAFRALAAELRPRRLNGSAVGPRVRKPRIPGSPRRQVRAGSELTESRNPRFSAVPVRS